MKRRRQSRFGWLVVGVICACGMASPRSWAQVPASSAAGVGDWPYWRGPNYDGISEESNWNPAALTNAKAAWTVSIGEGFSAVAVKGQRLFTMGNKSGQDIVYCLNAKTGAQVWERPYQCPNGKGGHPGPRATPVVDDKFVYTLSCEGHLFCLGAENGNIIWKKNLISDFQAVNIGWGFSDALRIDGDLLLINACQSGLVLKKKTGEKVWASPVGKGGYAVPVVFDMNAKRYVAVFGEKALHVVEEKTGQKLCSYPWETSYDINAADPIFLGGKLFITSGYGRGCALLNLAGGRADVVWQHKGISSHFSSCVLSDGHIYGIDGNTGSGSLVCLEWQGGKEKWRKNLGFGSLVAAGNKLIVLNERGELFVCEVNPSEYREISKSPALLPYRCWTMPVLSRGFIYIRNCVYGKGGDLAAIDVSK